MGLPDLTASDVANICVSLHKKKIIKYLKEQPKGVWSYYMMGKTNFIGIKLEEMMKNPHYGQIKNAVENSKYKNVKTFASTPYFALAQKLYHAI